MPDDEVIVCGSQRRDDLRKPITYEEWSAMTIADGVTPTRELFAEALAIAAAAQGRVVELRGFTIVEDNDA
jgi:hypothetical protein